MVTILLFNYYSSWIESRVIEWIKHQKKILSAPGLATHEWLLRKAYQSAPTGLAELQALNSKKLRKIQNVIETFFDLGCEPDAHIHREFSKRHNLEQRPPVKCITIRTSHSYLG